MVARTQRKASTQAESAAPPTPAGSRKGATQNLAAAEPAPESKPTRKVATSKKSAPVKLTDRQQHVLQKIQGAGATGYEVGQKAEQRTVDALANRKLIKRGTKNKESGAYRYLLTKAGEKHLASPAPAAEPPARPAAEPAAEVPAPPTP